MPRQDAAQHLAGQLHSLKHPSGTPHRLMQYSRINQPPETLARIDAHARGVSESVIHTLELAGYTISHRDDPKPPANETTLPITCANCGSEIATIVITNGTARMRPAALQALSKIAACPHA